MPVRLNEPKDEIILYWTAVPVFLPTTVNEDVEHAIVLVDFKLEAWPIKLKWPVVAKRVLAVVATRLAG